MPVIKQETILINDYSNNRNLGGSRAFVRRRTTQSSRTGKLSTKDRVTIDITAQPIVHIFDDRALGAGPAEAIRNIVSKGIKNIGKAASPETLHRRHRSRLDGVSTRSITYKKRYTGGRIKELKPDQHTRMFNDSGRLGDGVFVRQNTKTSNADFGVTAAAWTTNVPANRFTEGGGGHPDTQHLASMLISMVPVLKDPTAMINSPEVIAAIEASLDQMIVRAENERDAKRKALRLAKLNAARAALVLGRSLLGF